MHLWQPSCLVYLKWLLLKRMRVCMNNVAAEDYALIFSLWQERVRLSDCWNNSLTKSNETWKNIKSKNQHRFSRCPKVFSSWKEIPDLEHERRRGKTQNWSFVIFLLKFKHKYEVSYPSSGTIIQFEPNDCASPEV